MPKFFNKCGLRQAEDHGKSKSKPTSREFAGLFNRRKCCMMKGMKLFWKWLRWSLCMMLWGLFMRRHQTGRPNGDEDWKHKSSCRANCAPQQGFPRIRSNDVYRDSRSNVVTHAKRKRGKKERYVIALNDVPLLLANHAKMQGSKFIFSQVPKSLPVHEWRAVYARELYDRLMRPIDAIPPKERYYCRGKWAGTIYDRRALQVVAYMLGCARKEAAVYYLRYGMKKSPNNGHKWR